MAPASDLFHSCTVSRRFHRVASVHDDTSKCIGSSGTALRSATTLVVHQKWGSRQVKPLSLSLVKSGLCRRFTGSLADSITARDAYL
jgi:hypothetical protein